MLALPETQGVDSWEYMELSSGATDRQVYIGYSRYFGEQWSTGLYRADVGDGRRRYAVVDELQPSEFPHIAIVDRRRIGKLEDQMHMLVGLVFLENEELAGHAQVDHEVGGAGALAEVRRDDAENQALGGWLGKPGPVMDIVLSGARPGEKLYEELAYAAEQLRPTAHPGIGALARSTPPSTGELVRMIEDLEAVRASRSRADVLAAIRRRVPELRTAGAIEVKPNIGTPEAA